MTAGFLRWRKEEDLRAVHRHQLRGPLPPLGGMEGWRVGSPQNEMVLELAGVM
jgi:hypothetical protein